MNDGQNISERECVVSFLFRNPSNGCWPKSEFPRRRIVARINDGTELAPRSGRQGEPELVGRVVDCVLGTYLDFSIFVRIIVSCFFAECSCFFKVRFRHRFLIVFLMGNCSK